MKYYINEDCIGCGACNDTCPEIFEMTEQGTAQALNIEATDAIGDRAERAMAECPVNAIEQI